MAAEGYPSQWGTPGPATGRPLIEILFGDESKVKQPAPSPPKQCKHCDGDGYADCPPYHRTCRMCRGTGREHVNCEACDGKGKHVGGYVKWDAKGKDDKRWEQQCVCCRGTGRVPA